MVLFGERMKKELYPPWADKYIHYHDLKVKLKDIKNKLAEAAAMPGDEEAKRGLDVANGAFHYLLDHEIEQVLGFYKSKCAELEELVQGLEDAVANLGESPEEEAVVGVVRQMQPVAADLARLMNYVSLNMAGIRKALKKCAKTTELRPPARGFVTLKIDHPTEGGHIITAGTSLPLSTAEDLDTMAEHKVLTQLAKKIKAMYATLKPAVGKLTLEPDVETGASVGVPDPPALPQAHSPANPGILNRLASYYWSARVDEKAATPSSSDAREVVAGMENLIKSLDNADRVASRNARLVHATTWSAAQAGIVEPAPRDEDAVADSVGLWLNCINSGLYMANYNLVIPTLSAMCDHIGVSSSVVGIVIGCCDVTTIFGTLGYSIWTNTSYKAPLIASAVACIVGNLAYCLSYDMSALWLLIIARLLTGMGSARAVNRRYIAMYVSKQNRTAASALFVSLSAVGMALGPLLALPLSHMPNLQLWGISFNSITMGGWVMTLCWLLFMLVAALAFKDPLTHFGMAPAPKSADADPLKQPLLEGHAENGNVEAERKPLHHLASGYSTASSFSAASDDEDDPDLVDNILERLKELWMSPMLATACCIFLCFVLKLVQQGYIDGLSIFTEESFGWTASQCGLLLAVLGLVAPVINQSVGALSSRISDRAITVVSILTTAVGAIGLMMGPFPQWNFFGAGVLVYMGTIVLEAVSMSLCSKVIDERLAKGLWNAGLLSTQAGTLGRLAGNMVLSICAGLTGTHTDGQLASLARLLFGSCLVSMMFSLGYVSAVYGRLVG